MYKEQQMNQELLIAQEAFRPDKLGFTKHREGWTKDLPGVGPAVFGQVGWEHAQQTAYTRPDGTPVNALEFLAELQGTVWGMEPIDIVPTNVLSIIPATGGATLTAHQAENGFTPEGWLGFGIGFGSRGPLVSHMLGVRSDLRGKADVGWQLKVLQAYEALKQGHSEMDWTYDPMRGPNANLNIVKLGATVPEFTINKYGKLYSSLYGDVPTDRFTAVWDLTAERTHQRIHQIHAGNHQSTSVADIQHMPAAYSGNLEWISTNAPQQVAYEIPGDIDQMMATDQQRAIDWRRDMRRVFSHLLNTSVAQADDQLTRDPSGITVQQSQGDYRIIDFVTDTSHGDRRNFYVLERKQGK